MHKLLYYRYSHHLRSDDTTTAAGSKSSKSRTEKMSPLVIGLPTLVE
jgi:hypothetical protein